ncbi:uncharacterized protein LOC143227216 [Tachypleus tridentatus]|uniref:uncharacterized protein LOC143227216 n=1 Tax=Tachypleus tridentatus TaxID=6853 RepID=UPI003FD3C56A
MKLVYLKLYAVLCTVLLTEGVLSSGVLKKVLKGAAVGVPAFVGAKLGTTAALTAPVILGLGLGPKSLKGLGLATLATPLPKPFLAGPALAKAAFGGVAAGKGLGAGYAAGKFSGFPAVAPTPFPVSVIFNGLPALTPFGALPATAPIGTLPVTTPVGALPLPNPVETWPGNVPVEALSQVAGVEDWSEEVPAGIDIADSLLTPIEDWTLGDSVKFGYIFASGFDKKNDYGFFKTQGPKGYSTGFEITDPLGGYAYSHSSIATSRKRRSLQTTIPEESDLQKTDSSTSEDTLEPELVKTFTFIQDNDDNECVRKLVCEMAVDEKKYGQYGVEVTKFMLSLKSNDKAAPWYPYKTAATLGKKYGTLKMCSLQFPRCMKQFAPVFEETN